MMNKEEIKCWLRKKQQRLKGFVAVPIIVAGIMTHWPDVSYSKEVTSMGNSQVLKQPSIWQPHKEAQIVHEASYNILNTLNSAVKEEVSINERVKAAQSLKSLLSRYGKDEIIKELGKLKKSGKIDEETYNRLVEVANAINYDKMYKNVVTTERLEAGGKSEKADAIKNPDSLREKELRDVVCFAYLVSIITFPEMKETIQPEKRLYFTVPTPATKEAETIAQQIHDVQRVYNYFIVANARNISDVAIGGKQAYELRLGYPQLSLKLDLEPLYSIAGRLEPPEIGNIKLSSDAEVKYFGNNYKDQIIREGNNYYVSGEWLYTTPEGRDALKGYFSQSKWEVGGIKSNEKDAGKKLFELVEKMAGTYGYDKTMAWLDEHLKQGKITNEQKQMLEPLVKVVDEIRKRIVSIAYESTKDIMMGYAGFEKRFELKPIGGSDAFVSVGGGAYYTMFEVYDTKEKATVGTIYVKGELQWERYSGVAVQLQVFNDFGLMQDNKNIVDASALALGGVYSQQVGRRAALQFGVGGQAATTAQNAYATARINFYPRGVFKEVGLGIKGSFTNIDVKNILIQQGFSQEFAGAMGEAIPSYLWKFGVPLNIQIGGKNWLLNVSPEAGYMVVTGKGLEIIQEGGKVYWGGSAGFTLDLPYDWRLRFDFIFYK